ncbi:MAG: DoxX family protein [Burkholderiales bacterium]|jgi:putative oxidoreductase
MKTAGWDRLHWMWAGWLGLVKGLMLLQHVVLLGARWWVAQAFFLSGLTKLHDWETTLALFETEYQVPILSPEWAAYAGTAGELFLPVMLALGLGTRFAAMGLSVVNGVAVLSLMEVALPALQQHQLWGSWLLAVAIWGPGALSVDRWLAPWLGRRYGLKGARAE